MGFHFLIFLCFYLLSFPVVVPLKKCEILQGLSLDEVALYRSENGSLKPIPFQIDDRRKNGSYRYDQILNHNKWKKGKMKSGDFRISKYDELVFYSESLGEKATSLKYNGCEIELKVENNKKYAYLLPLPHSDCEPIATFYPDKRIIESKKFSFGFTDNLHPAVVNFMALASKGQFIDILDRFKMELNIRFFFGKITVNKTENDIQGSLTGYRIGCIRALLQQKFSIRLLKGINTPWAYRITKIYRNTVVFPNDIYIPFNPGLIITDAELLVTLDFNKNIKSSLLWTEKFRKKVKIDGRMSEPEKELNNSPFPRWVVMETPFGKIAGIVKADPKFEESKLIKSFYYRDDESAEDERGKEKGHIGEMGWHIRKLKNLKRGKYKLDIIITEIEDKADVEKKIKEFLKIPLVKVMNINR